MLAGPATNREFRAGAKGPALARHVRAGSGSHARPGFGPPLPGMRWEPGPSGPVLVVKRHGETRPAKWGEIRKAVAAIRFARQFPKYRKTIKTVRQQRRTAGPAPAPPAPPSDIVSPGVVSPGAGASPQFLIEPEVLPPPSRQRAHSTVYEDEEYEDSDFDQDEDAGFDADPFEEDDEPGFDEGDEEEELSGPLDVAFAFWRKQWDAAVAKMQAAVGVFLQDKDKIRRMGELVAKLDKAAASRNLPPEQEAEIDRLRSTIDALKSDNAAVEAKVISAMQKIRETSSADSGLGEPISITVGAVALALIVSVAGAAYIHHERVATTEKQLDMAARGILTPDQIAKVKGGGLLSGLGGALSSLPVIVIGGVVLYFAFFGKKGSRHSEIGF